MPPSLQAGAARRAINPQIGTRQTGFRLFGNPVQGVESDLTATALVLADGETKVAIIAIDLSLVGIDLSMIGQRPAQAMRLAVAEALDTPVSHVLMNTSHTHSGVAMPEYMPDTPEQLALKERYKAQLTRWLVQAAVEADSRLQPARVGTAWGESDIGVYRREWRDGRDVLGAVPGHPIDRSVGVIRIDDLEGRPIATAFRYSAHPVTVGPRSMLASSDYPGPAREVIERSLGGLALFLQGGGGNVNPAVGIGYEVDCRDTKRRVGLELGGEVLRLAASIETARRPGARRAFPGLPDILFTPWETADGGVAGTRLAALEAVVSLDYVELPSLERATEIDAGRRERLDELREHAQHEWQVRVAEKYEDWSRILVTAVEQGRPTCDLHLQALRIGEVVVLGMNAETFFETGLEIRARSPFPDTFVLGYCNGTIGYLPRAEDYPEGGWSLDETYSVPDMIFQVHPHPVAIRPDSERRAVEGSLALIERLTGQARLPPNVERSSAPRSNRSSAKSETSA